jgi:hypothetical protein
MYRILRHVVHLEDRLDEVLTQPALDAFKTKPNAATRPVGPAPTVARAKVEAPSAPPLPAERVPVAVKKAA